MSPGEIDLKIVSDRACQVRRALEQLARKAAIEEREFLANPDHAAATETYLRRALEALADLARHLLAKGHRIAVSDYAGIAVRCGELGVLPEEDATLFRRMLGYRNRLVHRYLEVGPAELYRIAREHATDLSAILARLEKVAAELGSC